MMTVTKTTRTHLVYQFIILTLLFLGIGYNELLPDRKFVLFLTFIPMFCYQLFILLCCMELLPIPSWMNFGESISSKIGTKDEKLGTDSLPSSPVLSSAPSTSKVSSETQAKKHISDFPDVSDRTYCQRRWEKSVTNLGPSPKRHSYPQKSKSWMSLSDSKSDEGSLSREGSLDIVAAFPESQINYLPVSKKDKANYREERSAKTKSWKPNDTDFNASDYNVKNVKSKQPANVPVKERTKLLESHSATGQDDTELAKSYSFPFRQKRLENWLEMKETETKECKQSSNIPYWQSYSYKLAVKYEAQKRRRAVSTSETGDKSEVHFRNSNFHKSVEITTDFLRSKQNQKKPAKSACARMSKIKMGFSNLISKKKDDGLENGDINSKILKPSIFKVKGKHPSNQSKKEEKTTLPECPKFLSNEKPFIFYPKNIPFEKKRFENDVRKKLIELQNE